MAKVILVDNFNRETIADRLLADNLTEDDARLKADEYNNVHKDLIWDWYARAVTDDHRLSRGMEDLI